MIREVKNAEVLFKVGSPGRYKLKQIYPRGGCPALGGTDALELLEKYHEPGWRVCSVTAAGAVLWIFYERVQH